MTNFTCPHCPRTFINEMQRADHVYQTHLNVANAVPYHQSPGYLASIGKTQPTEIPVAQQQYTDPDHVTENVVSDTPVASEADTDYVDAVVYSLGIDPGQPTPVLEGDELEEIVLAFQFRIAEGLGPLERRGARNIANAAILAHVRRLVAKARIHELTALANSEIANQSLKKMQARINGRLATLKTQEQDNA